MFDRDPFLPTVVYLGPEMRPAQPEMAPDHGLPIFRLEYEALHHQCVVAVARREKSYPEMVAAGRMEAADAERDIAAWKDLAAEWQYIRTGEGELPSLATIGDRIDAVELAADRLEAELERGRRTEANYYQHHLLHALWWHLRKVRTTAFYADLTRQMRAELRAQSERNAA